VDHHPCTIPNEESNHEPARPNTKYFEPSSASFMVNYIVDDLDAMLDRLAKAGVRVDPKRQDESYGRFAWIYDPDGNKIELWQPL
jgi:glyoxylase I family protein